MERIPSGPWGAPGTGRALRVLLLGIALAAAFLAVSPTAAAGDGCSKAQVTVSGDSCGTVASVALLGNAEGQDCKGLNTCITVAPAGNAENHGGDVSCGHEGVGCVAVSGTGSASNSAGDGSCGYYRSAGCIAVSGTGDASNSAGYLGCGQLGVGCIAVSGTGSAHNTAGADGCGPGIACVAVSGTGSTWNQVGSGACESPATTCVALTVAGDGHAALP